MFKNIYPVTSDTINQIIAKHLPESPKSALKNSFAQFTSHCWQHFMGLSLPLLLSWSTFVTSTFLSVDSTFLSVVSVKITGQSWGSVVDTLISPTHPVKPEEEWVPQWAKQVVWYQIFPERFRNGDRTNDPTLEDIQGAYPDDPNAPWQIHPWTADWYELLPYEQSNGHDLWANLYRRRYGGDLQGILDKLDYLQSLGISALYLNPVFQSPSSHKYDSTTYHHIDPTFGPDPVDDRQRIAEEVPDDSTTWIWTAADKLALQLIAEVHKRGMYIIFDGVFNHVGKTHWAFQDVLQNQRASKFKDWFNVLTWDDPIADTTFTYQGWYGLPDLPEWREEGQGIVDGPTQYIFDITRRWLDPDGDPMTADGIDGWRLDVPFCVNHTFWKAWRQWVKSINPEAYIVGEVIDTPDELQSYLLGDEFDAVMNYGVAFAFAEHFLESPTATSLAKFDRQLQTLRDTFAPGVAHVMQNLFSSHDTDRLASHIVNYVNRDLGHFRDWGHYYEQSKATNPGYDTRKPTWEERRLQKFVVIFQMTYVGAPMVYYGDEVGMWGANDPDDRKPMLWDDFTYAPETYLPDGSQRQVPDQVGVDHDLLNHYRTLIAIRNHYPVLQLGDFQTVLMDDDRDIYSFARRDEDDLAIVVLNGNSGLQNVKLNMKLDVKLDVNEGDRFVDVLNRDRPILETEAGTIELDIPGLWGSILIRR